MRAMMSLVPPGGSGTTNVIGRVGILLRRCAGASAAMSANAASEAFRMLAIGAS